MNKNKPDKSMDGSISTEDLDLIEDTLVSGIRDFASRLGFTKLHLGLSGGLDSALVAYLAAKALGPEKLCCISMPSRFSSKSSKDDAAALCLNLGCKLEILPIEEAYAACLSTLKEIFNDLPFDTAEENIQTRIRGVLAMAYSNKFNSMLLCNSNKSEIAMGYCTIYGIDTIGVLAPIGDLFKTQVYALSRRINQRSMEKGEGQIIPQSIIDKPPSAELRPDQKDEDSLPPYAVLDPILELYLTEHLTRDEIAARGWDAALVDGIIKTVVRSEFKKSLLPPFIKVEVR